MIVEPVRRLSAAALYTHAKYRRRVFEGAPSAAAAVTDWVDNYQAAKGIAGLEFGRRHAHDQASGSGKAKIELGEVKSDQGRQHRSWRPPARRNDRQEAVLIATGSRYHKIEARASENRHITPAVCTTATCDGALPG